MKTLQKLLILLFMAMFVFACDNDPVSNTDDTNDTQQTDNTGDDNTGDDNNEEPVVTVTDDFDSYTVGEQIDVASGDLWGVNNMKDNSDGLGTTTAEVSDAQALSGTNSLFLEDKHSDSKPFAHRLFDAAAASGSITFSYYTPSANEKVSYFNVGIGKNNSDRYFELRANGTKLEYESGSEDTVIAEDVLMDTWHTVTMAWTDAGIFTITLDDVVVGTDIDQATTGLTASNTPTQFTIYTGDNSSVINTLYVDDVDSDLLITEVAAE